MGRKWASIGAPAVLAVLGEDQSFWLCRTAHEITPSYLHFDANWMERGDTNGDDVEYVLSKELNSVPMASYLCEVKDVRRSRRNCWLISLEEEKRIQRLLDRRLDNVTNQGERAPKRKRKSDDNDERKRKDKRGGSNTRKRSTNEEEKKRKRKKTEDSDEEESGKSKKSPNKGKKSPNWRLTVNPSIAVEEDAFLRDKSKEVMYTSSLVNGKLAIRAVLTRDMKLLKSLIEDTKRVASIHVGRNLASPNATALYYAIATHNLSMYIELLTHEVRIRKKPEERVNVPQCRLKIVDTGSYTPGSIPNVNHVRQLNMSRGSREGNNALLKDYQYGNYVNLKGFPGQKELLEWLFEHEAPLGYINFALDKSLLRENVVINNLNIAIRMGHTEVASIFVKRNLEASGHHNRMFNELHLKALEKTWIQPKQPLREASCLKKDFENATPLHYAAVNSFNSDALNNMLMVCPDLNIKDSNRYGLVHYAAANKDTKCRTLAFLAQKGANLEDTNRLGETPLMIASKLGRIHNVEFICKHLINNSSLFDDEDEQRKAKLMKRFGLAGVNRGNKNSFNALHLAAENGHLEVMKYLIEVMNADPERTLNAKWDRKTPLMLAASKGYREIVEYLTTNHCNAMKKDKCGRTALSYAIMNGQGEIAAFLLRLGMNADEQDSSGNSLLHYASAYGWLHCANLLLLAGAKVNIGNDWQLVPLAVAAMKGHEAIVELLLKQPGVDINFRDAQGRTLLLTLVSESESDLSSLSELSSVTKQWVRDRNADATAIDKSGKNALHYLCALELKPITQNWHQKLKEFDQRLKIWMDLQCFLVKNKCSTLIMDENGDLPLNHLLRVQWDNITRRKNYCEIQTFLNHMIHEVRGNLDWFKKNYKRSDFKTFLHVLFENLSFLYVEEESRLLKQIATLIELSDDKTDIVESKNSEQKTSFIALCEWYAKINPQLSINSRSQLANFADTHYKELKLDENLELSTEQKTKRFRIASHMLINYYSAVKPNLKYEIKKRDEDNVDVIYHVSAVCILATAAEFEEIYLKGAEKPFDILTMNNFSKADLDLALDERKHTALHLAIKRKDVNTVKRLLRKGCDANAVHMLKEESANSSKQMLAKKSNAISDAVRLGNSEIVTLLLQYSIDLNFDNNKEFDQLFKIVVSEAARHRDKDRLMILQSLCDRGLSIKSVERETERNALHLVLGMSQYELDQSLALEVELLNRGVDLHCLDCRGRTPLHYLFVKFGKHMDSSSTDPIELLSIFSDAAKSDLPVNNADNFGCTALHYAAYRGASVSCLHLLQMGADIEIRDELGNSALAYAVLGRHEATTLLLLQLKANFEIDVTNFTKENKDERKERILANKFANLEEFASKQIDSQTINTTSLLYAVIQLEWIGITQLLLLRMQSTLVNAIAVAFEAGKLQFAKNLISRQVMKEKLRERVAKNRNLLAILCVESKICTPLTSEIFELLKSAGVDEFNIDDEGNTALHYACLNRNQALMEKLIDSRYDQLNENHVSPLAALFFDLDEDNEEALIKCLEIALKKYTKKIFLTKIKVPQISYISNKATLTKSLSSSSLSSLTPLSVCLLLKLYKAAEFIISKCRDTVNYSDDFGRSPLMHCVNSNDIRAALLISNGKMPNKIDLLELKKTWKKNDIKKVIIDVKYVDEEQETALHKAVRLYFNTSYGKENKSNEGITKVNGRMRELLIALGVDTKQKNKEGLTYLELAKKLEGSVNEESGKIDDMNWDSDFDVEKVKEDANKMLQILEKKANDDNNVDDVDMEKDDTNEDEDNDESGAEDDEEDDDNSDEEDRDYQRNTKGKNTKSRKDVPKGCIVQDGAIHEKFDVVMTKIDINKRYWDIYNFYRLQIWKENGRDLYILFTNWGRIGDSRGGQYQNTPFGTAAAAESEFRKIFAAKSGNEFDNYLNNDFVNHRHKYVPVNRNHLEHVQKKRLEFDLESGQKSVMSDDDVINVLKDACNVAMFVKNWRQIGSDQFAPFGRIGREEVLKAVKILEDLKPMVKKKKELESKINVTINKKDTNNEDQLMEITQKIWDLSSEYYRLMPSSGQNFLDLRPLDEECSVQRELSRSHQILDFTMAERLLLAAQFNKKLMSPLDHIYRATKCELKSLNTSDLETKIILNYVYNSAPSSFRVTSILRVNTEGRKTKFRAGNNRRWLFHGTKTENLLSILASGLLTCPQADIRGRSLGDGIYSSDSFIKSLDYSDPNFEARRSHFGKFGRNRRQNSYDDNIYYVLLCDVNMEKPHVERLCDSGELLRAKYRVRVGNTVPNPNKDIKIINKNVVVPLGKPTRICNNDYNKDIGGLAEMYVNNLEGRRISCKEGWRTDFEYSEFVVAEEQDVDVAFVIRLETI